MPRLAVRVVTMTLVCAVPMSLSLSSCAAGANGSATERSRPTTTVRVPTTVDCSAPGAACPTTTEPPPPLTTTTVAAKATGQTVTFTDYGAMAGPVPAGDPADRLDLTLVRVRPKAACARPAEPSRGRFLEVTVRFSYPLAGKRTFASIPVSGFRIEGADGSSEGGSAITFDAVGCDPASSQVVQLNWLETREVSFTVDTANASGVLAFDFKPFWQARWSF